MFRKCSLSPERKLDAKGFILSFWPEWEQKINDNEVAVVFRRNAAIIKTPAFLYAYLNKPKQKVIGRSVIESITRENVKQCLSLGPRSGYSDDDIRLYVGYKSVVVYHLGRFEVAPNAVLLRDLSAKYNFTPSPQACLLSEEGRQLLDRDLGF